MLDVCLFVYVYYSPADGYKAISVAVLWSKGAEGSATLW